MQRRILYLAFAALLSIIQLNAQQISGDTVPLDSLQPRQPAAVQEQKPAQQQSAAPSAPATVKLNTPTLNMDVLLDLYNKDIDFTIDYSGEALKQSPISKAREEEKPEQRDERVAKSKKEAREATDELLRPRQEDLTADIQDIVDTSKAKKKTRQGSYSKEDADYNKALASLQEAQKLFSMKRYLQALNEINKSIEAAPNLALAHAIKGSIHYMLRQLPEAKVSWEKALELDPSLDNVRAILYRIY